MQYELLTQHFITLSNGPVIWLPHQPDYPAKIAGDPKQVPRASWLLSRCISRSDYPVVYANVAC